MCVYVCKSRFDIIISGESNEASQRAAGHITPNQNNVRVLDGTIEGE
jgi:hypothetical protein